MRISNDARPTVSARCQPATPGRHRPVAYNREHGSNHRSRGLRKRFGPTLALDGMTFTVLPGQVTGFVGPNGAGKSTTMRVILGLDAADAGTALIGGRPYASAAAPAEPRRARCWTPAALQPSRSARNHLLWLAHSQGLGAPAGSTR